MLISIKLSFDKTLEKRNSRRRNQSASLLSAKLLTFLKGDSEVIRKAWMKDDIGEQNDVQCETTALSIFKTQSHFYLIDFAGKKYYEIFWV